LDKKRENEERILKDRKKKSINQQTKKLR